MGNPKLPAKGMGNPQPPALYQAMGMVVNRGGVIIRPLSTVLPAAPTVLPAQAGIQKYLMGSMPVFGRTVLDSRLRGNDGRGAWNDLEDWSE